MLFTQPEPVDVCPPTHLGRMLSLPTIIDRPMGQRREIYGDLRKLRRPFPCPALATVGGGVVRACQTLCAVLRCPYVCRRRRLL